MTLAPVSTSTLPSTTEDSVIRCMCMNKWRWVQLWFLLYSLMDKLEILTLFHNHEWNDLVLVFTFSMQLEKKSLPMEGACHIIMEVLQAENFTLKTLSVAPNIHKPSYWIVLCPSYTNMLIWDPLIAMWAAACHEADRALNVRSDPASLHTSRICSCSSDEWLRLVCSLQQSVSAGGQRNDSIGPIRDNRIGCLIYIAIRLAVFIHHFRLFITPVQNSMQWISCDIKSQFFPKAGTGSKLKDC